MGITVMSFNSYEIVIQLSFFFWVCLEAAKLRVVIFAQLGPMF
jgi:hypothetical protein